MLLSLRTIFPLRWAYHRQCRCTEYVPVGHSAKQFCLVSSCFKIMVSIRQFFTAKWMVVGRVRKVEVHLVWRVCCRCWSKFFIFDDCFPGLSHVWHVTFVPLFSVMRAWVPLNPFHTQQCRLRVDGVIVVWLLWVWSLLCLQDTGVWFWAGLWRWWVWPDVMHRSDLHQCGSCPFEPSVHVRFGRSV